MNRLSGAGCARARPSATRAFARVLIAGLVLTGAELVPRAALGLGERLREVLALKHTVEQAV